VFAIDLCDLRYGEAVRRAAENPTKARVGDDWAVIARIAVLRANLFVREITTFIRNEDGAWRRDDERHENVLVDTCQIPALLAPLGLEVTLATSFGDEVLPEGLVAIVGQRSSA
jgi:hypothetical protein